MRKQTPVSSYAVAVALGANLGDRAATLAWAVGRLRELLTDVGVSPWRDTEPVDAPAQPRFLNGALVGRTSLSPQRLLEALQQIELDAGRERPFPNAPRTLDLDLVLYGDVVVDEPGLRVPHPRFRARRFVLEPLADIAPDWVDPETGRTVEELLRELDQT
ncbi:MAG: 2-amino-4-hydroxy-6-hydroxymethyldihydropteridine diphosphokinase [Vicinamibacterales bacterium]